MKKYYAVRNGRIPGIYNTWDECRAQVDGFSGAEYKSFTLLDAAKDYVENNEKEIKTQSEAVAYVDGSFLLEKSMFSYGAVIFYKNEELHFSQAFSNPELVSMRNVAGEIKGAEFVMQFCLDNNISSLDLYYDYEGIEKWCTGAWRTNKFGTKYYSEFYKKASEKVKVNFIKVRGHSGDKYNDLVDSLAKKALGIN